MPTGDIWPCPETTAQGGKAAYSRLRSRVVAELDGRAISSCQTHSPRGLNVWVSFLDLTLINSGKLGK